MNIAEGMAVSTNTEIQEPEQAGRYSPMRYIFLRPMLLKLKHHRQHAFELSIEMDLAAGETIEYVPEACLTRRRPI